MKTRNRWLGSFVLVACVLAVGLSLGYAKYREIEGKKAQPPPPEMPVAVTVRPVSAVSYRRQTTMIGTVLAPQSIMLSNEVAGTVSKVGFESGDTVAKDQILIELDASVEKAELLSAQARARLTESSVVRMRRAAASAAITATELEEAEAQHEQAVAAIAQLEAVIARKTLRAPFPARIGLSNTHLGQFLPSGFQIATLQSIEDYVLIDFMIPQSAADAVEVGNEVKLVDAATNYSARIMALDARADRLSRNLMARARLSPVPRSLVPGDSVRVVLEYGPQLETPAVPLEAVRRAPMNTFVYVAESDNEKALRAVARTVSVGTTVGDRISVLEGLKADEQVVVDGSFKLQDGMLIVPIDLDAQAQPSVKPAEQAAMGHASNGQSVADKH
jgi:membrane fusion protein, multidrug efflux system